MSTHLLRAFLLFVLLLNFVHADGPQDNLPDKVRPIPPRGMPLPEAAQTKLRQELDQLSREIAELKDRLTRENSPLRSLLPDVEIFSKAVRYALENQEFYNLKSEIPQAHQLLAEGRKRLEQLRSGKPAWTTSTGLVVRGYRSRLDDSVQPYGLVVPANYTPQGARRRLDIWLHGRGEKLTELSFLSQRQTQPGIFTPKDTIVLHPYGRYCNAFKFAGEIDVLEALEQVQQHYRIDPDRIVMRGFSMGGAGCWQFAVHYPDRWVASAPGAGFSETPQFLDIFQKEKLAPTWYEKKLWRLYDCDGYAANLFNLPTIAYSGEKDRQKQAADVMAEALNREGIELVHLLGPGTGHSYHPQVKAELDRRIDQLAALGRPRVPQKVRFSTYTLRYNRSYWVQIEELLQHWEKATVEASLVPSKVDSSASLLALEVKTTNVAALTLSFAPGQCPESLTSRSPITLDGQSFTGGKLHSDRSWSASFRRDESGKWHLAHRPASGLRKRHGLQGPIDDAFMDSFLMIRPTGKGFHPRTSAWVNKELTRALDQWRRQFRGDPRVKDDTDITEDDITRHHLVLWGDPSSNKVLNRLHSKLPISWDATSISVAANRYPSSDHVALLIYPNPFNPRRYVVLNSGFTFREYDQLNNARQVPKLPDFAILDIRTPPSSRWPGKVVEANFFDERWQLPVK